MPLVSVCILTKNSASYVGAAVRSVLSQTIRDLEIVIVDGGSSDETLHIVEEFHEPRIRIIESPEKLEASRGGVAIDRNVAVGAARGKYLAWLDSDDVAHSRRLELQVHYLEANPSILACGSWAVSFGDRVAVVRTPVQPSSILLEMIFSNPFVNSSMTMRRDHEGARSVQFESAFEFAEDYAFWQRMSEIGPLVNLPRLLTFYRHHSTQNTRRFADSASPRLNIIRARALSRLIESPGMEALLKEVVPLGDLVDRVPRFETLLESRHVLENLIDANRKARVFPDGELRYRAGAVYLRGANRLFASSISRCPQSLIRSARMLIPPFAMSPLRACKSVLLSSLLKLIATFFRVWPTGEYRRARAGE